MLAVGALRKSSMSSVSLASTSRGVTWDPLLGRILRGARVSARGPFQYGQVSAVPRPTLAHFAAAENNAPRLEVCSQARRGERAGALVPAKRSRIDRADREHRLR